MTTMIADNDNDNDDKRYENENEYLHNTRDYLTGFKYTFALNACISSEDANANYEGKNKTKPTEWRRE